MVDNSSVPRIAPAEDDSSTHTSPEPRLSVSKQWVLPPRPKPGRKPKAQPTQGPKRRVGRPLGKKKTDIVGEQVEIEKKPEEKHDDDDESCNLCTRDDCMCETIGLKNTHKLPSLDSILKSTPIKMDAVPLQRPLNGNASRKFRRIEALKPLHPPLSAPSPMDNAPPTDNCGFCTDTTTCACAEVPVPAPIYYLPPIGDHHALVHSQGVAQNPYNQNLPPQSTPSIFVAGAGTVNSPVSPHSQIPVAQSPFVSTPPTETKQALNGDSMHSCAACSSDALSMLFCLSLTSSHTLAPGAVALPCHLAFKTLKKHPKFDGCDLGRLVSRLEVSHKQVGVQSINRVLQELDRDEFMSL